MKIMIAYVFAMEVIRTACLIVKCIKNVKTKTIEMPANEIYARPVIGFVARKEEEF